MKTKWKLHRKRTLGFLACTVIYAVVFFCLMCQSYRVALCGLAGLVSLTALLCLYLAWRPLKVTSLIVAGALMFYCAPVKAQDGGTNQEPFLAELGVAAVLVAVGVVICLGIHKLSKKIPAAPPADPDDPPVTNCVPRTNTVPPGKKITLNLSDSQLSIYNCSNSLLSNPDPAGNHYERWFHGRIECSSDLINWTNVCTLHSWASDYNVCTVYYDNNGQPYSTNFCSTSSGTNLLVLPWLSADPKAMYVRLRDE